MQPPIADLEPLEPLERAGFRFGDKGTHTSRTMMLAELEDVLAALPEDAERADYASAIVDENVLGKRTDATRRLSDQRLAELHGLDPGIPIFRVLRRLWGADETARPLLALLSALARDPLLRSTADTVIALPPGAELVRSSFLAALRQAVGSRLNESTLDKVARNAGSTWTQSGHLAGRVRKIRQRVSPTPAAAAMALWMGTVEGILGEQLLRCRWVRVLDASASQLVELVLQAKQLGLLHARIGGNVVELDAAALDPALVRRR